jgi:hypothetical protein
MITTDWCHVMFCARSSEVRGLVHEGSLVHGSLSCGSRHHHFRPRNENTRSVNESHTSMLLTERIYRRRCTAKRDAAMRCLSAHLDIVNMDLPTTFAIYKKKHNQTPHLVRYPISCHAASH